MSWTDLDWPDLSPDLPVPQPASEPPPPPEDVPEDIALCVERAERRRARGVKRLVLCGALVAAAGVALYAGTPHGTGPAAPAVLVLFGAGFALAFPGAALAALWLGPTWTQRQQHYRLLRWRGERRAWLARERARYLGGLSDEQQRELRRRIRRN